MKTKHTFYTIGHSNLEIDDFIKILLKDNIKLVADVRSLPGSTKFPQYNIENLSKSLADNNIKYEHISKLGGLRKKSKEIPSEINGFWQNKSFHNYADYTMSDDFKTGLDRLIALGSKYKTVIMCAEVLWWRCHRRIITDYLLSKNHNVYHILNINKKETAIINPAAVRNKNNINYPSK